MKRALNSLNGQLEQVRREAVRLSNRSTPITPDQLVKLNTEWGDVVSSSEVARKALETLSTVAYTYV